MPDAGVQVETLQRILRDRVIAVLRGDCAEAVHTTALGILDCGLEAVEITMTVPDATEVIRQLASRPGALVGAGSVRTAREVDICVRAGARFIVSPAYCPDVAVCAKAHGVCVILGAMTPSEVLSAWNSGSDLVKVFPAARLGPVYFKDLHGPFPEIPLVATGGITGENAASYLEAGASVLCFGTWLTRGTAVDVRERVKGVRALIDGVSVA